MAYSSLSNHYEKIVQLDTKASQFKPVAKYIASPIKLTINNLSEDSKFADQWKITRISSIPKVTNPIELKDYCPISILPILSKVYETGFTTNFYIETQQVNNNKKIST